MPMSGTAMAGELLSKLTSAGLLGTSTPLIAKAIGEGSITSLLGLPFSTEDIGVSPGASTGAGVGIKGIVAADIELAILASIAQKLGTIGTTTPILANAIALTFVNQLSLATLTSTQPLLFSGSSIITIGSIVPVSSVMTSLITSLGTGFLGTSWPLMAAAISEGLTQSFKTATGTLVLTPITPPPNTPVPGTPAKGTGSIS